MVWGRAAGLRGALCLALALVPACAGRALDRPDGGGPGAAAGALAAAQSRAYALYLQARQERGRDELDRAAELLAQAIDADPRSAALRVELAQVRLEQGRPAEARALLLRVLAADPEDVSALATLAVARLLLGDRAEAVARARQAAALAPDDEGAPLFLADVLRRAARRDEACRVLEDLVARFPASHRGLAGLGRCHEERGEFEAAGESLRRSVAVYPDDPDVWVLLGTVLEATGADAEAEAAYRRAVQLDDDAANAQVRLWELLRRTNRPAEAQGVIAELGSGSHDSAAALRLGAYYYQRGEHRKALDQVGIALRAKPDDTTLLAFAAGLRLALDDRAGALEAFDRLLALSPGRHDARIRTGILLREAGRTEQALEQFRFVIENAPRYGEAYVQGALTLAVAGRPAEGLHLIEQGMALLPGRARLVFHRGLLRDRTGDGAGAEQDFRETLRLEPGHAGAGNALGYLFARQGVRLDEAVALISAALATEPGNPGYLDSLGWARFRRGETGEALANLGRALERRRTDRVILGHLDEVCRSLADPGAAPQCRALPSAPPSPSAPSSGR